MRLMPKATKVKMTFYKGITVPDMIVGLCSLVLIAVTVSTNFPFRWILALTILFLTIPLYIPLGGERLYVGIWNYLRYFFSKKRYKQGDSSSLIPYREAKGNLFYNKDGTLFGAMEIEPINFDALSEDKQDGLIEGAFSRILDMASPEEEWFLLKADEPLVLEGMLEKELKRMERLDCLCNMGLLAKKERDARIDICQERLSEEDALNSEEITHPAFFLFFLSRSEKRADEVLNRAISILDGSGMSTHRLGKKELLRLASSHLAGNYDSRSDFAEVAEPDDLTFYPLTAKMDGIQATSLVIDGFPMKVPNGWGERLFSLPNTHITMRMRPINEDTALKRIDHAILEIETRPEGKESEYQNSVSHVDSLRELLTDIQQGNQTLYDVVTIVTVYDEPKSNQNRKLVKQALREMGFRFSEMGGRQEDAFVSSMVSSKEMTKKAVSIQTDTLAAVFPFAMDVKMDENGLYLGDDDLPCFVDFFRRDLTHVNSNLAIIGQSGSGKSYASKAILKALASQGERVFVLDPEAEYGELARELGGVEIDASDGSRNRINPFEIIAFEDDSNAYYVNLQFLEQFYRCTLNGISQDALEELNRITQLAYESKGIGPYSDFSKLGHKDYPTFDDVYAVAEKKLDEADNSYEKSCIRTVLNYLSRFVKGGRDSSLWNGPTSFNPKASFVSINFQRLLANKNESTSNAQMLLLLRWLEQEVIRNREYNKECRTGRKTVIAIDEAHLFIDEKYPIALDFMHSLAKRIRKYDGMLIVITQSLRDFTGTPEVQKKAQAIMSVCQYSMIFSLSPNDMNDLTTLYQNSGGFTELEKDEIAYSQRGECLLISCANERGRLIVN